MLIIVVLTLPGTYGTMKHYLPSRPPAKLSNEELEALAFLEGQPLGVVLTQPFNKDAAIAAISNPPRSLRLYESTAYVSAFSKKPVFLEDEVNLNITGYNWRERRRQVEAFFANPSGDFLSENNIKYVYITREKGVLVDEFFASFEKVYENEEVIIVSVEKP